MGKHDKVRIDALDGAEAIAPVIISASRSTDIPAFHAEWFMQRLRAGYCQWRNPFNQAVQNVSFEKTRVIVFWSKNPRPILPYLDEIEDMGYNYYFQFTLNNYERKIEPYLPPLEERIETFQELSERIGLGRMVWRYDPILCYSNVGLNSHFCQISRISRDLRGYTRRMVFSFADVETYRKVQYNLKKAGIESEPIMVCEARSFANAIAQITRANGMSAATCAEGLDLSEFGIKKNQCIDPKLIAKEFGHDDELMKWLGYEPATGTWSRYNRMNPDPGQRKECGCILNKDIGAYTTCGHGCVYCYANTTPELGKIGCWKAQAEKHGNILGE